MSDVEPSVPPDDPSPPKAKAKRRPLLEVVGLTKIYALRRGLLGRRKELVHALSGVSFELKKGETLGVVGESGSGKSTLGRTLLRLVEPTLGRVRFDGIDVTRLGDGELRKLRRRMQIVFQDPQSSLDPRMTLRDVVAEGLDHFGLARGSGREDRVRAALDDVGLGRDVLDRYPGELSGGQRQRIAIARALIVEPELVVCDEPTSALDVSVGAQIVNLLEHAQEERQLAYVFISHDLRTVERTAHRIAVMYLGKIVEIGPATAVATERLHPYTEALFAAAPRLAQRGRTEERRRLIVAGEPPHGSKLPSGCAFHPRCPIMEKGRCDREAPTLRKLGPDGHEVACFKVEGG